jgi:hypothetical protein
MSIASQNKTTHYMSYDGRGPFMRLVNTGYKTSKKSQLEFAYSGNITFEDESTCRLNQANTWSTYILPLSASDIGQELYIYSSEGSYYAYIDYLPVF